MVYLQVFAGFVDGNSMGIYISSCCSTVQNGVWWVAAVMALFAGSALHALLEQLENFETANDGHGGRLFNRSH
jgi:hypothetical protein